MRRAITTAVGSVYFAAGATEKIVTVSVRADRAHELEERFELVLSEPEGAGLTKATGTARIADVD